MPRLRATYVSLEGIWFVEPPDPPILLAENKIVSKVNLLDDGNIIVYFIDAWESAYKSQPVIGTISIEEGVQRDILNMDKIIALEKGSEKANFIWIPGTHRTLFYTLHWDAQWGYISDNNLFELNLDTGAVSRIFKLGQGGIATPSPDGTKMAVANYGSLFLFSIRGQILFPNLFPSGVVEELERSVAQIFWASDSSRFGILLHPPCCEWWHYPNHDAAFWAVDAATGDISALGSMDQFGQGVISPTLEYIGYTRWGEHNQFPEDVTLARFDDSSSLLLFRGISNFISFSPDGLHYFYSVGCQQGTYSDCPSDAPPREYYLGSLDGNSIRVPWVGEWINNSQFVVKKGLGSLGLGDINGNWIEIAQADYIHSFDAVDLDFQTGGES
jgi:hypothetical protein